MSMTQDTQTPQQPQWGICNGRFHHWRFIEPFGKPAYATWPEAKDKILFCDCGVFLLPTGSKYTIGGGPLGTVVGESWILERSNAQQQRLEAAEKVAGHDAELIADSLDDVLQWRTIADEATERIQALEKSLDQTARESELHKLVARHWKGEARKLGSTKATWELDPDQPLEVRIEALEAALRRQTTLASEVLDYMAQDYVRISSSVPAEFRLLVHQACEEWDRAVETAVALLSPSEAI